ncbi:tetratricopeptide repeat protein [Aquimarina sp. MMG016]|uniref:tetratricopeptide repeat protein n=1 Tax=Aquimarina sp. MMG016 TaxID=2822690 RepID=UPI001B3A3086|nr:tetratricopeptide repeat protein [Aquimarina sp. MMG016]MBQ4819043.1 tetratricopeptide repeat protein [Aquimarina sp. MMG016]
MKPLVNILLILGCFCFYSSTAQNQQKIDSLLQVIKEEQSHDTTRVKAFNDLGLLYASVDPKQAKSYINKALTITKDIESPRGMAGTHNCLGIVYYYQKEYDSARISFEKALTLNQKVDHKWGQASALNQIGVIQMIQDKYHDAIQSYRKAKVIFEEMKDTVSMVSSIDNIGLVYLKMGDYQKASSFVFKALQFYENMNNEPGIRRGYFRMSSIARKQGDYEKALEYSKMALPFAEKDGNKLQLASALTNMADSYSNLKEYDKAIAYFNKALEYRKLLSNKKGMALVQSRLGKTYYDLRQYEKSITQLRLALNNFSTEGDEKPKALTHNHLAKSYQKLNELNAANLHANTSLNIAQKIGNIEAERDSYLTLAAIAEDFGKNTQALQFYKNYQTLNDSIYNKENEKRVRELQTIYETEKKEQEIVLQQNEIELLEQKAKTDKLQRIVLGYGLIISIIIFGLGFYGLRQKIKRSRLEKEKVDAELAFKKKELTTHALHLAKKNEVLESLKQKAKTLQTSENGQNGYQQLIQTINFDLQDDNNWENFRKYFEQVHKDFNINVKKKFPDVTSNELRLMALLKMNLSSKEIANILNISSEGIKKARYRLRKKLEITTDKSLQDLVLGL